MAHPGRFITSNQKNFISPHVGGNSYLDNDPEYLAQQQSILLRHKSTSSPTKNNSMSEMDHTDDQPYDPYNAFLVRHGLNNMTKKTRYITKYINVDSSTRTTQPTITTNQSIQLASDPLYFSKTQDNLLIVESKGHKFVQGDRITLTGVITSESVVRTSYLSDTNTAVRSVEFTAGSTYVKIVCPPNMTKIYPLLSASYLNQYVMTDVYVKISGFQGYPLPTHIGNIPLNALNKTHLIYLQLTPSEVNNLTYFYIKLPEKYKGSINVGEYNITLTFLHIGGIPLNVLNAEYPIDGDHLKGYHVVNSTQTDSLTIVLPKKGIYEHNFGGDNVYISKILNVDIGYPNPNKYSITLDTTYLRTTKIRLVSTTFPNTSRVFRKSDTFQNTKLYWQNNDDGDIVYSAEIDPGNYDPDSLKTAIETKVRQVKKISVVSTSTLTAYTNNNYIQITIDKNSNIVTFKSYKEALLSNPITKVSPQIETTQGVTAVTDKYTLTIQHINHGILTGDTVLFSGMISHLGIPADSLNQEHTVTVEDDNTYKIDLEHINLAEFKSDTHGGYAVKVYVPNTFRLLFNYPDTMGKELGFRNVGLDSSVTEFSRVITNQDKYFNEIEIDELGNQKIFTNNSLTLSGDDYILMTCREISNLVHIGKVTIDNVFAKINLTGLTGKILYDTYVSTPAYFYDPITISKLSFEFCTPTGELYDFLGVDHSFVLEIVTIDESNEGTGIVSKTGREY